MDIEGCDKLQFIKLLKCNTYSIPSQLLTPRRLNENHICFGSPATKTSRCLIKTPQLSSIKDLNISLKKYFQGLVETVAPQLCPQQETCAFTGKGESKVKLSIILLETKSTRPQIPE